MSGHSTSGWGLIRIANTGEKLLTLKDKLLSLRSSSSSSSFSPSLASASSSHSPLHESPASVRMLASGMFLFFNIIVMFELQLTFYCSSIMYNSQFIYV